MSDFLPGTFKTWKTVKAEKRTGISRKTGAGATGRRVSASHLSCCNQFWDYHSTDLDFVMLDCKNLKSKQRIFLVTCRASQKNPHPNSDIF